MLYDTRNPIFNTYDAFETAFNDGVLFAASDTHYTENDGTLLKMAPVVWQYDDMSNCVSDRILETTLKFSNDVKKWEGNYALDRPINDLHALSGAPETRNAFKLYDAIDYMIQLRDPCLYLVTCGMMASLYNGILTQYTTNETWFAFVIIKSETSTYSNWYDNTAAHIAFAENKIRELHNYQNNDDK